ncbi:MULTISPECIES: SGNH/GDSL hydrolase family protein [unclassified Duganella]|uniref:SGNH/GDSL hydrolase family protein n=1 Tax=unclassified Duganella TaxID=2636909 RepID=UPI000891D966|nr:MULTISPECIES: SGNH/GDSL hydrolase family protein [unclassified Duganella]SDG22190.1 Phospholipase/lecithinase/hemolysin [Duganella sp. OV458]SDJ26182.1 Phospholipase/lecithinase/hemolysin [Duganella sp. OV510]
MRHTKLALAAMALAVLAGCGGTDPAPGDQSLKVKYASQVSFGDSLSDVGSYNVGTVAALKGGKFTINGDNTSINATLTGKNWTELMAAQIGVAAPCAAVTGLDGDATKGFSVPAKANSGCYGYAMGGSRVTNPVGPNNKLTGSALGALTYPVATQIANHLKAVGGKFKGDELVLVMAGGNDALFQLGALSTAATAAGTAAAGPAYLASLIPQLAAGATNPQTAAVAITTAAQTAAQSGATQTVITQAAIGAAAVQPGNSAVAQASVYGPMVAKATADATAAGQKAGAAYATTHGPELVAAMGQAGTELVALVKSQLLANGANYVVVNNLPDVATTPAGRAKDASTQALINAMVSAFNTALTSGLSSEAKVVVVDVFAVSHDQATNPGPYGLTNVSETACNLTDTTKNPLGSSLTCNGSNLVSGDVSHYSFADDVHPTPYNNLLLARYVSKALVTKGWL